MQDCTLAKRFFLVKEGFGVDAHHLSQSVAAGAHSLRVVKRKSERWQSQKRLSYARIQQSYIGCEFRRGTDRAAEVAAHLFLVYDYGSGQILYLVHVRTGEFRKPCPGKRTEGFDELSLSFGVNRIEEQRGLAAAAGSGKDHDAVFGNVQVNVFQVVGVSVPDNDSVVVLHSCK